MPIEQYVPSNDRRAPWLPEYVSRILHAFFKVGDAFTGVEMTRYLRILYPEEFAELVDALGHSPETHVPGILSVEYQRVDMPACSRLARITGTTARYEVTALPLRECY
jgi:hypothetical protein